MSHQKTPSNSKMEIDDEKNVKEEEMEEASSENANQNPKKRVKTNDNNNTIIPIHTVPIVIMEQIFSYLSAPQVQICAFVCKRWKTIYESFMEKYEEILLKQVSWFSCPEKSDLESLEKKLDKELEFQPPGTFRVSQIERTVFLFSLKTDTGSVKHLKIEHNYGKWVVLSLPMSAKYSLTHLLRDVIESFIPLDKGFVSVQNENEISNNSAFIPRVNLDGCVHSFTDKLLIAALKKNCYIRALHFIGKEWLKESSAETSWALACLLDNFSITSSTFQYAGSQVAKAKNIALRNERFIPILRVFELCNNDQFLQLWAYQSLVNEYGNKKIDSVALHFACARGMEELAEVLLNKGVSPFYPIPETEETPFMFALRNRQQLIVKLFEKIVHHDQPLIGWCGMIERGPAEKLLEGKPPGTFLTRYSSRAESYVVTMKNEKEILHLVGWKKSEDGSVTAERNGGKYKYYANLVDAIYDEMVELRYPMKSPVQYQEIWKDPKLK